MILDRCSDGSPAPPQPRALGQGHARLGVSVLAVVGALALDGCDLAYPEVAVVNRTAETVALRALSFSGCLWEPVLAFGETTTVQRCLPGEDRIRFQKLDAAAYCREQAQHGTIAGLCPCDGTEPAGDDEAGLTNAEPNWFNYQTVSQHAAGYGDFQLFEITLDDVEQDFSVPGPYGH